MTPQPAETVAPRRLPFTGKLTALVSVAMLVASGPILQADVPDKPSGPRETISGYFRVVASNDPLFPVRPGRQWFMDFGQGEQAGRSNGSVAVSLRENPNVRVRMLVWQFYPDAGTLIMGNQTGENSRQAVTLANWRVFRNSSGFVLQRGQYQISLRRAREGE